jgi:hypothetical protein
MLTDNEIALVRASFARVVPIQSAATDLFYDRLFAILPKLRELFPADLRAEAQTDADDLHSGRRFKQSKSPRSGSENAWGASFWLWRDDGTLSARRRSAALDLERGLGQGLRCLAQSGGFLRLRRTLRSCGWETSVSLAT